MKEFKKTWLIHIFYLCMALIMGYATIVMYKAQYYEKVKNYAWLECFFIITMLIMVWKVLERIDLEKNERILLGLVILVGIILRVVMMVILKTEPISDFKIPHDFYELYKLENKLSSWYQLYYTRFPAYYAYMRIIEFIYDLFGFNVEYIKVINLVLCILTMLFMYFGGRKAFGKRKSMVAVILFAICPSLISYASVGTPDHISILLFLILFYFIISFKCNQDIHKKKGYVILIGLTTGLINLFKPISIFFIFAYLGTEILVVFSRKEISLKKQIKEWLVVTVVIISSIVILNKINEFSLESRMKMQVVDSTPMYLLWGYAVDENNIYKSSVVDSFVTDTLRNNASNQEIAMEIFKEKAHEQILNNKNIIFSIWKQKFELAMNSEYGFLGFANTNSDAEYVQSITKIFHVPFLTLAAFFMLIIYFLCMWISVRKFLKPKYDIELYGITFLLISILGYIMILVLGGVQSRYKALIVPYMFLVSGVAIEDMIILIGTNINLLYLQIKKIVFIKLKQIAKQIDCKSEEELKK